MGYALLFFSNPIPNPPATAILSSKPSRILARRFGCRCRCGGSSWNQKAESFLSGRFRFRDKANGGYVAGDFGRRGDWRRWWPDNSDDRLEEEFVLVDDQDDRSHQLWRKMWILKVWKVICWHDKFGQGIVPILVRVVVSMMLIMSVSVSGSKAPTWALSEENRLFLEAWRTVDRAYYDKTFNGQSWFRYRENALRTEPMNNREETYMAIRKMLSTLEDPFTRFLEPEKFKSLRSGTQGSLTGVGLSIGYPVGSDASSRGLDVISSSPGGPANKASIKPGDVILAIDNQLTEDMDIYEAAELLQPSHHFPMFSHVVVSHAGARFFSKALVSPANIAWAVRNAIESLRNKKVTSFILDLRDNSGGLFPEGIETAKIWLDKGVIVYICDSHGVRDIYETDGSNALAVSEPLIVLVNRGTASASEILAGALKDNNRAVLFGEPTYGKGKIQSVFELSDGSGLAVTVARYETPGHTNIDKVGITPDHPLPPSFPLDEDSFCGCLKDPASSCYLNTAAVFSR
ncbi:C-terminal processing peptidase, chloroplastic [Apostasia shenzhenica]|uniref:C-terminal processing peptidase n=1 Tax=Apostasia shenzhenica TaxID=1088818 RepID=A0A2I0ALA6_9ASPA|nr:C-terminal processing peptidase, chloroplastic [Apostasia shenzhenica]